MRATISCVLVVAGASTLHSTALADNYAVDDDTPSYNSYAWREPRMLSDVGVAVALGIGFGAFIDDHATSALATQQADWSARLSIGTHIPLGLEIAYVGTHTNIDTLIDNNAALIGSEGEAALRFNILPHYTWDPYVFAGIGLQRYDVTNTDLSLSDDGIADTDNLTVYPLGAGLSYRSRRGLVFDVRGTVRLAGSSDLIIDTADNQQASLHTWEASSSLGYEF